ncbi:MAG: histone deacetylase [Phycisphaerae bacterium]
MTKIGIAIDERFERHDAGAGHPERPSRLSAIRSGLERAGLLSSCRHIAPASAADASLKRVHPAAYIERVQAACRTGRTNIDEPDCGICPESESIARLAAGSVIEAARMIGRGELRRAFCAVRPPGHHAERERAMGFCLYANIALAALALREECGMQRVAILDWDVHHGNGTQHIFESDPSVLFISLHGHPDYLYPGSGFAHEQGVGAGRGFTVNLPFMPGVGDAEYRGAFNSRVIPEIDRFQPQALLISAGFDAHGDDPLGNIGLTDDMFAWMAREAAKLADRHAAGRILSVLEGGYNLDVLRRCVPEHVDILAS